MANFEIFSRFEVGKLFVTVAFAPGVALPATVWPHTVDARTRT